LLWIRGVGHIRGVSWVWVGAPLANAQSFPVAAPERVTVTKTATPTSSDLLTSRLAELRAERDGALGDSLLEANGDVADRATNVEATIRLQLLDERIALLEREVDDSRRRPHTDGVVSVGDVVTLDFGDGSETYVLGSVEQALAGVDTVTPGSPLGQALLGAAVGESVDYSPRPGTTLSVRVVDAGVALKTPA
jgi:transcription elongation factor GreA